MRAAAKDLSPSRRWSRGASVSILAAVAVLFSARLAPTLAQMQAGSVTSVVGAASLRRAGSILNLVPGMSVQVADQVIVGASSKVLITLSDGSLLEAGSSSTVIIDEELLGPSGARVSTKVRLLSGILRSVAKHAADGTLPNFEVHTPNAILAARGTTFDTSYSQGSRRLGYGDITQFTDEQTINGLVGVRNPLSPTANEVSVPAGYETTIADDSPPSPPGPSGKTGIPWQGSDALTATEPGPPPIAIPAPVGGEAPAPPPLALPPPHHRLPPPAPPAFAPPRALPPPRRLPPPPPPPPPPKISFSKCSACMCPSAGLELSVAAHLWDKGCWISTSRSWQPLRSKDAKDDL